jgi:hypothetical protein
MHVRRVVQGGHGGGHQPGGAANRRRTQCLRLPGSLYNYSAKGTVPLHFFFFFKDARVHAQHARLVYY